MQNSPLVEQIIIIENQFTDIARIAQFEAEILYDNNAAIAELVKFMPKMPANVLYVPMMLMPIARCSNDRNMRNLQGLLSKKELLIAKLLNYNYNGVNESVLTEIN